MWLFLNDAFLSIVIDRDDPDRLLCRSRARGDLEALFGDVDVIETPSRDYRFRVSLPRSRVASAVSNRVLALDYDNFKSSVPEADRHDCYLKVWTSMLNFQEKRLARGRKAVGRDRNVPEGNRSPM